MKKRTYRTLALALALLIAIAAFPMMASATKEDDTFIYAITGDPGNDINTISTSGRFDLMAERMLYSPLYNYYGDDDMTMLLAESVEVSEDCTQMVAHLRQGVKWSDGVPFTADDVVFTYEKIMEFDYANGHDGLVYDGQKTKVEKLDDYTVQFTTPFSVPAIREMVGGEKFIMPKHIYEGDEKLDNNPKNATPVGTGPYTLAEYSAGQFMKFQANPDYFMGAPKIGTIVFQVTTDANTAGMALKKGEINALVITNDAAADFEGAPVELHAYPEDRVGYVTFNMDSPAAQDVNFRKAVMYAMNREEMNLAAYLSDEYFVNADSFLPYAAKYYTQDIESYQTDLDKAKEYLAKVENPPKTLRVMYSVGQTVQEVQCMVMQQQLKKIGIDVEIQAIDGSTLQNKLETPGDTSYDMYCSGYIMGIDPSIYATLYTSGSAANYSRLSDEELDGLFKAGAVETDPVKREEIYVKAQQRLADLAVQYSIVTNKRILGVSADVGGVEDARLVPIYTFESMDKLYFK